MAAELTRISNREAAKKPALERPGTGETKMEVTKVI